MFLQKTTADKPEERPFVGPRVAGRPTEGQPFHFTNDYYLEQQWAQERDKQHAPERTEGRAAGQHGTEGARRRRVCRNTTPGTFMSVSKKVTNERKFTKALY